MATRAHLAVSRDLVVFVSGLVVFLYEAFGRDVSDPTVTYGALAAMGVAAFLRGVSITNGAKK